MLTQKQSKIYKKSKIHKKSKIYKKSKTNGGGIFNTITSSIVQFPKEKNYTVRAPGSGMFQMLNPANLKSSTNANSQKLIAIIFNYHLPNQFDITNIKANTILSSNTLSKEPYVLINNMGKYVLVMYRIINKKNAETPKLLLHWVVGYMNRMPTKIFHYIAPKPKSNKINKFAIKLFKLPDINDKIFFKINNINKKKAYEEFNNYIKSKNLLPINTYNFMVKYDSSEGINLFNMVSKK